MIIRVQVNGEHVEWEICLDETLLDSLRRYGFFGAKFGGCQSGECGVCAVLLDGKPVNSCTLLAAQVNGHSIDTIEGMGEHPE
ncbi:MAG TPA: 2Fe-2S iron-sulfur cluster-binding protein, partial [Anaerolineaceae bacterium]|nr:2Fe-2S iron-sulfur cluster-binding protein [Anaerolineaceae bacterium]